MITTPNSAKNSLCNDRNAFCIKAIHHRWQKLELLLDGMAQEVGVYKYVVGGYKSGIVLEEQCGRDLWTGSVLARGNRRTIAHRTFRGLHRRP